MCGLTSLQYRRHGQGSGEAHPLLCMATAYSIAFERSYPQGLLELQKAQRTARQQSNWEKENVQQVVTLTIRYSATFPVQSKSLYSVVATRGGELDNDVML